MRLFISIPLSPETVEKLTQTQVILRDAGVTGNYVPAKNLHITLAFLGEVPTAKPVLSVLQREEIPASALAFTRMGRIRDILTADFRADPALFDYVRRLRQTLENAGISFDHKPFRPHVTLVRRAVLPDGRTDEAWSAALSGCASPVERVCLMRTDFEDRRANYTVMGSFCPANAGNEKKD